MLKNPTWLKKRPSNEAILRTWKTVEKHEPDKSTAYLMQKVCDLFDNRIDHADVAEALRELAEFSPSPNTCVG